MTMTSPGTYMMIDDVDEEPDSLGVGVGLQDGVGLGDETAALSAVRPHINSKNMTVLLNIKEAKNAVSETVTI